VIDTIRARVARPDFWPAFWRYLFIAIGVAGFAVIATLGFNLALEQLGCKFMWNMLSGWCGTHTGLGLTAALFVTPVALYYSIRRPWIFPVCLYVLLLPSDSYLTFTSLTGGSSLTKVAGALAALALLFHLIRYKRFKTPGKETAVWLLYVVWCSLTMMWSYNINPMVASVWGTLVQLGVLYLIFTIAPLDNDDDFKWIFVSWIIGCMAASLFGAEVFGVGGAHIINEGRLKASFNPDNKIASDLFAASFVFPLALVAMTALRTKKILLKIGYVLVFGVLLVGQFIVGSRGGMVADCVMLGYFMFKGRYRGQILFLASTGLTLSLIYPSALWDRILTPDPSGGSGRIEIWKVGAAALKHYWLFGSGFDTFPQVYNKYFLTIFNQYYEHWSRAPHNIILQAWVELGIFGLALMLWGWWQTFRAMRFIPKWHEEYDTRVAIEGGVLGAFVAAIFVGVMFEKFTWWMFTIVALWRQVSMRRLAAAQAADDERLAAMSIDVELTSHDTLPAAPEIEPACETAR